MGAEPEWESDRLERGGAPVVERAYFDEGFGAWVLSRHEDVLAAFRCAGLAPVGPNGRTVPGPEQEAALAGMREGTLEALSAGQLKAWQEEMAGAVAAAVEGLPVDRAVDLLEEYAAPLCLGFASAVTGSDARCGRHLREVSRVVSESAAVLFDAELRAGAKAATAKMAGEFGSRYETLRDSGFVAVAHTMPSLLGNAWYALARHPAQWKLLQEQPGLVESGVEELLRFAGLTRILFRVATEDVVVGDAAIGRGERLVLRLVAANRDPERFEGANTLDVARRGAGHLALGAGAHACVGASLIRMIALAVTRPLVERFGRAELVEPVEWRGGAGFRAPVALRVRLGR